MSLKLTFETFRKIGTYESSWMMQEKPSASDSSIRIRKYKITIEVVEEPVNVLQERLQMLWEKTTQYNERLRDMFIFEAQRLGYKLEGPMGGGVMK